MLLVPVDKGGNNLPIQSAVVLLDVTALNMNSWNTFEAHHIFTSFERGHFWSCLDFHSLRLNVVYCVCCILGAEKCCLDQHEKNPSLSPRVVCLDIMKK